MIQISAALIRATAALTAAVLTLVACSGGDGSGLRGIVSADGSSTVFPVTEAVAEEFQRDNPRVDITVGVSGTGGGFKKFCAGETDMNDASREIKESEAEICREAGIDFFRLSVATDGLAVVVSTDNDWVECLTTQELGSIWEPGSKVNSWSQVREGFPDEPLKLFGPGTDSGTFDYFTHVINGEEGASRVDYSPAENDNTLVIGVAGNPGGMAYFGYAYYSENADKLKLLSVDGGEGCVQPTDETVTSNEYSPLSRPLFLYVNSDSVARPEIQAFLEFYLENSAYLATDVGYSPVSDEVHAANVAEYEAARDA